MKPKKKEKGVWVTQAQVNLTGSPDIARFLAQCVYWSECKTVEQRSGWFYKTRDEWQAETWLSRFKQEKARKKLKALGLLQERHERRNDGIRLWYRINLGLLNNLLNNLEVVVSNDMNVRSEKTTINETIVRSSDNSVSLTDSMSIELFENTENSSLYSGEISTNVQSKKEETPYSLNPQDYVFCHVFIYQFVKTRISQYHASWQQAWQQHGLDDHDVFDAFCEFVERHGQAMVDWYRTEAVLEVPTLTADDLLFAQIAGRRCYESA